MFTIAVPSDDLASEEVCTALRNGLGAHYNVLPGIRMNRSPLGVPRTA
jgi:hypothetical protein